ncbi:hypothetical protein [Escherichia coli]|uniref:hypothetical protein n=1 Tax=Escherichia coli TaxID=562 RepID=UPI002FCD211E
MEELVALPSHWSAVIKRRLWHFRRMASVEDVQDVKAAYAVLAASELASVATAILSDEAQSEQAYTAISGDWSGMCAPAYRQPLRCSVNAMKGERETDNRNRITTGADVPGNHSEHEERGGIRAGCRPAGSVTPPTADAETGAGRQLSAVAGVAVVRDYSRAAELQRLNPQLRDPNNITAGMVINAYAK